MAGQRGAALLLTFLLMLILAGIVLAIGVFAQNSVVTGKSQFLDAQALHVAQAGLARGRQAFAAGTWSAGSTTTESFGPGEYTVTISASPPYTLTASGYLPNATTWVASRQVTLSAVTTSTNLALNPQMVATASSSNSSNTPERARDGSTSTNWRAQTTGSGQWLTYDFQTATTVQQVVIDENQNITGVTVAWSDNDSTWTNGPAATVSGSGNNETYTVTFSPDVSHRYFRATFTASGSARVGVDEMTVTNSAGTLALTAGSFATQW